MTFENDVLKPVRTHLGRNIQVPAGGRWDVEQHADHLALNLEIDVGSLSRDFQTDRAALPSFLVCLSYWLERARGQKVTGSIRVLGEPPSESGSWLHWNRAAFLLDQLQLVLAGRLTVRVEQPWQWPPAPMLNVAKGERSNLAGNSNPEHVLETFLCRDDPARELLCAAIGRIGPVVRQLPVGLFDGHVAHRSRWTPGGKSQVDLWATSEDGSTVHLFEIKANGNVPLGILPEAFYYLRLLHHVRVGLGNGVRIAGNSPALDAIRAAQRLKIWLLAPNIHPLVLASGESPLAWLNEGMKDDGAEMCILPIELRDGVLFRCRVDERWPRP